VQITLRSVQELGEVTVRAAAVAARLARTGFYDRRRTGLGTFITPERVDSLSHVSTPAQLLRDVRGLTVHCRSAGRCLVQTTANQCLNVVVNGAVFQGQLDDILTTSEIAAIEVYERRSLVPVEFKVLRDCGAIVVWTRGRVDK
jgi:hypothetical protein